MAAISIRDLDDDVPERLRIRAAANGRSMEAEVRAILTEAVRPAAERQGLLATRRADRRSAGQQVEVLPEAGRHRGASGDP